MVRGLADLPGFSAACAASTAALSAALSAGARRRDCFCMRGRLVDDEAMRARSAPIDPGAVHEDIMAIGRCRKKIAAALPKCGRAGTGGGRRRPAARKWGAG